MHQSFKGVDYAIPGAKFWVNGMVYEPNKVPGFSTLKPNLSPIEEIFFSTEILSIQKKMMTP